MASVYPHELPPVKAAFLDRQAFLWEDTGLMRVSGIRFLCLLLLPALLPLAVHWHPSEPGDHASGPRLETDHGFECAICRLLGSGVESPPPVVALPAQAIPQEPCLPPAWQYPSFFDSTLHSGRDPPALPSI